MVKEVSITEVCPRDGFQNVKEFIDTEKKIEIAKVLMGAGFKEMEIVSFISPKWIPQMADAYEVSEELDSYRKKKNIDIELIALAPNAKGIDNAAKSKADAIVCPISVSEMHNKSNVNRTREESFEELEKSIIKHNGLKVEVGLACTFGTPFKDDKILIDDILWMAERAFDIGAFKVVLSDTVGNGSPAFVNEVLTKVKEHIDIDKCAVHLHDTMGFALINSLIAMEHGITKFEGAAAGLGGCPFAPGAAGNIATEDVINLFEVMGVSTNIKFDKVLEAVGLIKENVKAPIVSRLYPYCEGHKK